MLVHKLSCLYTNGVISPRVTPGLKWPEYQLDYSPNSIAKVKNTFGYTSLPHMLSLHDGLSGTQTIYHYLYLIKHQVLLGFTKTRQMLTTY